MRLFKKTRHNNARAECKSALVGVCVRAGVERRQQGSSSFIYENSLSYIHIDTYTHTHTHTHTHTAEIIMMDNFTLVFRSGSDAHFYVVGDGSEVGVCVCVCVCVCIEMDRTHKKRAEGKNVLTGVAGR